MNCELRTCVPCTAGVPPLRGAPLYHLAEQLGNRRKVVDEHHLEKEYRFKDFAEALAFTNRVGELADQEGRHPDILLFYDKVTIYLWTQE